MMRINQWTQKPYWTDTAQEGDLPLREWRKLDDQESKDATTKLVVFLEHHHQWLQWNSSHWNYAHIGDGYVCIPGAHLHKEAAAHVQFIWGVGTKQVQEHGFTPVITTHQPSNFIYKPSTE
jgi:hypothetical protein